MSCVGLGAALVAWALLALACGSSRYPHPPYVRQSTSALVEVPYPPPPGRVEFIPPKPTALPANFDGGEEADPSAAVWIDGGWQWSGERYTWHRGRWVLVPAGVSYSPWTTVRRADGTLFFAPAVWRDARGGVVDEPLALALGTSAPGADASVRPRGMRRLDAGAGGNDVLDTPLVLGDGGVDPEEPAEP